MRDVAETAIPPMAVDAHASGMRIFTDAGGNVWTVRELDGQLACDVAGLPTVFVDAPGPLEEMSEREIVQLIRSELEPREGSDA